MVVYYFSNIYTIQIELNYSNFVSCTDEEKKKKSIDIIWEGINKISKEKQWEIALFKEVYSAICNGSYVNEWKWKRPVKNRDKSLSAEVIMQHDVRWMSISLLIRDKKGLEIHREEIISELPDEYAYAKHLGKLVWQSNSSVALINKKKDRDWKVLLS